MSSPRLSRETLEKAWRENRQGVLRLADWLGRDRSLGGRNVDAVCRALGIREESWPPRAMSRNR